MLLLLTISCCTVQVVESCQNPEVSLELSSVIEDDDDDDDGGGISVVIDDVAQEDDDWTGGGFVDDTVKWLESFPLKLVLVAAT